jgi:hypothetical protein
VGLARELCLETYSFRESDLAMVGAQGCRCAACRRPAADLAQTKQPITAPVGGVLGVLSAWGFELVAILSCSLPLLACRVVQQWLLYCGHMRDGQTSSQRKLLCVARTRPQLRLCVVLSWLCVLQAAPLCHCVQQGPAQRCFSKPHLATHTIPAQLVHMCFVLSWLYVRADIHITSSTIVLCCRLPPFAIVFSKDLLSAASANPTLHTSLVQTEQCAVMAVCAAGCRRLPLCPARTCSALRRRGSLACRGERWGSPSGDTGDC